jgi:hypothetical protein
VDGPPLYVMPKPFMVDSADEAKSPHGKSWSDKVLKTVEPKGAKITVVLRADREWLASPQRKYPVVIDPTIKIEPTSTSGQDAQIWSDTPDRNDGPYCRRSPRPMPPARNWPGRPYTDPDPGNANDDMTSE